MAMIIKHTIPNHPRFVDLTGQVFGELTVIGYAGRHKRSGQQAMTYFWCRCVCGRRKQVWSNNLRNGRVKSCGSLHTTPSYRTVHARLRTTFGSASEHYCTFCGATADQWAYTNDDPDELIGTNGERRVRYSTDLSRFIPLCVTCHKNFDNDYRFQNLEPTCPRGHLRAEHEFRRSNGNRYCRECNRERARKNARKARS